MASGASVGTTLGLCVLLLAALAPAGAAERVEQEVAGNDVTVYVAETETTHTTEDTDTFQSVYHQETRTSGVWVNDDGANLTATNYSRVSHLESGVILVDQEEHGVLLELDGTAAGATTDQSLGASVHLIEFQFSETSKGFSRTVSFSHHGFTSTDGAGAGTGLMGSVTDGELSSSTRNHNPPVDLFHFLSAAAIGHGTVNAGPVTATMQAGGAPTVWLGGWNGVEASAFVFAARCFEGECQLDQQGTSVCLVGYRPPLFLDCPPV